MGYSAYIKLIGVSKMYGYKKCIEVEEKDREAFGRLQELGLCQNVTIIDYDEKGKFEELHVWIDDSISKTSSSAQHMIIDARLISDATRFNDYEFIIIVGMDCARTTADACGFVDGLNACGKQVDLIDYSELAAHSGDYLLSIEFAHNEGCIDELVEFLEESK